MRTLKVPSRPSRRRPSGRLLAATLLACAAAGAVHAQEMLAGQEQPPDRATLIERAEAVLPLAAMRELGLGEAAPPSDLAPLRPTMAPPAVVFSGRAPVLAGPDLAPSAMPPSDAPPLASVLTLPLPTLGAPAPAPMPSAAPPESPPEPTPELLPVPMPAPSSLLRGRVSENLQLQLLAEIPRAPTPGAIEALPLQDEAAPALLQLSRRLTEGESTALAGSGVVVESFVGGSTYVVSAGSADLDRSGLGALVTAGRALTGGDKLRAGALDLIGTGAPQAYHLTLVAGTDPEATAAGMEQEGIADALPAPQGVTATLTPEQARAWAAQPEVLAVDAAPVGFLPLNMVMRAASDADAAQDFDAARQPPLFHGRSGQGTRIAIYESVDEAHQDFCSLDGSVTDRFFHRYSAAATCGQPLVASRRGSLHGTHVAAIAAGNGRNSAPNDPTGATPPFALRGVAPAASLSERQIWNAGRADLTAFLQALAEDGADVSNHSYVEALAGYDPTSAAIDAAIRNGPAGQETHAGGRPQVWAAGNNGTTARHGARAGYGSVLTQAKNAISVGSVDTTTGLVSSFSSLGPTLDGRIKPDLVAPGCHDSALHPDKGGIRSARAGVQGYHRACGTSQAAPVVAGAVALMCEAAGADCPVLAPAAFKAALVATARDLSAPQGRRVARAYGAGPDFASGFGLVDIAAAVRMIADPLHRREAALARDGEVASFCFTVAQGAEPLRLALAWDDPPPAPTDFAQAKLVNDLDLVLFDPAGGPHAPWRLQPLPSQPAPGTLPQAERGQDRLNNVELAEAEAMPGQWRAEVRAFSIGQGPQRLSLAGNVTFACDDS